MTPSEPNSDASSHQDSERPGQEPTHDTSPSQEGSQTVIDGNTIRIHAAIARFEIACSTVVERANRARTLASEQTSYMRDEEEAGRRSSADLPGQQDIYQAMGDLHLSIADLHNTSQTIAMVTCEHDRDRLRSAFQRALDGNSGFNFSFEEWQRAQTMWSGLEVIEEPIDAEGEALG